MKKDNARTPGPMTLGLFPTMHIKLKNEMKCAATARTTQNRELLLTIARKFPNSREIHSAIFANPMAQRDPVILASVEKLCRDKVMRLPYVAELLRRARSPQITNDDLAEFVVHPLAMVRELAFNNRAVIKFAETTSSSKLLRAMAENDLGANALAVKRIVCHNQKIPQDCLTELMSNPRVASYQKKS